MDPASQKIVVLTGLPGCGKSTWVGHQEGGVLSSDAVRLLLADNEDDQTIHVQVFSTLRFLLRQRLRIGRPVTYIDATHLTPAERLPYIKIARAHGCQIESVFFNVPLEVCRQRNAARPRVVPNDVLDAMQQRLVAPTTEEGFDLVTTIG
jgi:predicted kinase